MVGVYSPKISRIWFVARRDDPALPPSADSDRLPARLRIIVLFNRCVECIHVDMYDFAQRAGSGEVPSTRSSIPMSGLPTDRWPGRTHSRKTACRWGAVLAMRFGDGSRPTPALQGAPATSRRQV